MDTLIDWFGLWRGRVGPERAFEAFVAQLFERKLRRENGPHIEAYVLKGAGGDGGVEAFAKLPGGRTLGLQAKWFPDNLDAKRISQIKESLDTALKNFPGLAEYVVALPQNLTFTPVSKRGSAKAKGGVDRWKEFIEKYSGTHPELHITRWDESALVQELTWPENQALRTFWFSNSHVGQPLLETSFQKARHHLRNRYSEDLHVTGQIEEVLSADLFLPGHVARYLEQLGQIRAALMSARKILEDATDHLGPDELRTLAEKPVAARQAMDSMLSRTSSVEEALNRGPEGDLADVPSASPLWQLHAGFEELDRRDSGPNIAGLASPLLRKAAEAAVALQMLTIRWRETLRPRLLIGGPGLGKTHAAVHAVATHLKRGMPALLIVARDFNPQLGAEALLSRSLDQPGWSLATCLSALEGIAISRDSSPKTKNEEDPTYTRTLIVIDGLEESAHHEQWPSVLSDLAVEMRSKPRIHLVATLRDSTAERIPLPEQWTRTGLDAFDTVDMATLFHRYAVQYSIDARQVPWIAWALPDALSVRLFADAFRGHRLTLEDGFKRSVGQLLDLKLSRVSEEARQLDGVRQGLWPNHLISELLFSVVDTCAKMESPGVEAREFFPQLQDRDPEFTAERIRKVLDACITNGLIDELHSDISQTSAPPQYLPATNHITDYIIGRHAATGVLPVLEAKQRAKLPPMLSMRPDAAIVFGVVLAERGYFIADDLWLDTSWKHDPVAIQLSVLARLPPSLAGTRTDWVRHQLVASTRANRVAIRQLIRPIARIPGHPLGVRLLDEALRSKPLAQRDPVWSVPEGLPGTGPWTGRAPDVFRDIALDPEVDCWDGLPLLMAWTCSSLVESRRTMAREQLAVWGARRIKEMTRLLAHMAVSDDPQVVEDVSVAALGAALGARLTDDGIPLLARRAHDLFFAEGAPAWTSDIVVRMAARGIVEWAHHARPGSVDALLPTVRPPYAPRGPRWPAIDMAELKSYHEAGGGEIVSGDLHGYVAKQSFEKFLPGISRWQDPEDEAPLAGIPLEILRAVDANQIHIEERGLRRLAERAKRWTRAPRATWSHENTRKDDWRARWSPELNEFVEHVRVTAGLVNEPHPFAVRNAAIAAVVRGLGWSPQAFLHHEWEHPTTVDDAIAVQRGTGVPNGTHGNRNPVARFHEKYVWVATHIVAGELADRLPIWDEDHATWSRPKDLSRIGIEMPDPLPANAAAPGNVEHRGEPWVPDFLWPRLYSEETNLLARAERWLSQAPLPPVEKFLRAAIKPWPEAAVLGLYMHRIGHMACVDQAIWGCGFSVPRKLAALWRRDAPFLKREQFHLHKAFMEPENLGYLPPSLAIWPSEFVQWGELHGYRTLAGSGRVVEVTRLPFVANLLCRDRASDEFSSETEAWLPGPFLAQRLNVVSFHGDSRWRESRSRSGDTVAVEVDQLQGARWRFGNHYFAIEWARLMELCRREEMVPVWAVRLMREAHPALWMKNSQWKMSPDLPHRSRNVYWLVFGDPSTGELDPVLYADELEPWPTK
ncbi:hypothetical protein JYJ95_04710 [Corallococcus exiguus]|uniref:hypothetical protein n=1 Tax=Corallococcus exiguus TaxID=83462 RepID=UPI001A9099FA|nr:hypothetical protein [Corallococcus exiguus]MBN8465800.1 hypothetical protein [Corallococcus exiguus]